MNNTCNCGVKPCGKRQCCGSCLRKESCVHVCRSCVPKKENPKEQKSK